MFAWILGLADWMQPGIFAHDAGSYYCYLPAVLIEGDHRAGITRQEDAEDRGNWQHRAANGFAPKMSMGLAMLQLPFFACGHAAALLTNEPADGYSPPYAIALLTGTMVYVLTGLLFLRGMLLRWFDDRVVAWTLAAVALGTNLFWYATSGGLMAHGAIFGMSCVLLERTCAWCERPQARLTVVLGLLTGWLTLTRPTNLLLVMAVGMYVVFARPAGMDWRRWCAHAALAVVAAAMAWLPQLLFWRDITGHWWHYSYGDEGFFWSDPKLWRGLLGWRKGWLIYTPVMVFALAGIILLRGTKARVWFWPTTVMLPAIWYVLFAWWCWWYGGSFGMRAMIDYYALLAVPLASALHWIFTKKAAGTWLVAAGIGGCIALNLFQSVQYRDGYIHWDSMTWPAYRASFDRSVSSEDLRILHDSPEYNGARKGTAR
jgi:hypothetical protein